MTSRTALAVGAIRFAVLRQVRAIHTSQRDRYWYDAPNVRRKAGLFAESLIDRHRENRADS